MKRSALLILIFCLLVSLRNRAVPLISSSTSAVNLPTVNYGSASPARSFTVSGTDMQAGILVTPPPGFQVSLDNATFTPTVTVGSAGTIPSTTVYIRLPGTANADTYSGNISLTAQGAAAVSGPLVTGKIDPLKVDLAAYLNKSYGEEFPDGTYYYNQLDEAFNKDLKNGNKINSIDVTFTGGNKALDKVGTYFNAISIKNFTGRDGYLPGNYIFNYNTNNAYVVAAELYITANNVTKPFGTQLNNVTASTAFTAQGLQNGETITTVDIVYGAGAAIIDPPNVYTGSVEARNARGGTIDPANYKIYYINGTLTIPPPEITPSSTRATNTIIACVGSASVAPFIQQFTFTAKNLTTDVTVAAPAGFEIARAAAGPFGTRFSVATAGGIITNAVVYIRSAATAAAGQMNGDVLLTSSGATLKAVAVSGTINALPTFTRPGVQNYKNGEATTAIKMTGTGNYYTWTNDNPSIGLAASGTGDIASFKAINTNSAPIKATVTVIPASVPLLVVNNAWDRTISTVDVANNKVINSFTTPGDVTSVVLSPDQTRLYVGNSTSGFFYAYNATDHSLISSIATGNTNKVIVHPNGKRVYLINAYGQGAHVDVINTETVPFTRVTRVPIGESPTSGVLSNDNTRLYVASSQPYRVTAINTADNSVSAIVQTDIPVSPNHIAISPDDSKVYVAGVWMSVINTTTYAVTKLNDIHGEGLVVSPDGSKLYSSVYDELIMVNAATGVKIGTAPVKRAIPWALNADGTQLFTTNIAENQFDKGSVSVINTTNNAVISTLQVGALPYGLAVINGTGCPGIPERFDITVNPTIELSSNGTPSAVSTEYGTNSASSSFTIQGINISQPVTVKVPAGFSVSINNGPYATQSTFPATLLTNPVTISIRLDAITNAGDHSGDITITSTGANTLSIPMPKSVVTRAPLKLGAENAVKFYGEGFSPQVVKNSGYSITAGTLKNGNTITAVTINYGAGRNATDEVKTYPGSVTITDIIGANGFDEKNYDISRPIIADIIVKPLTFTYQGAPSALDTEYGTVSAASTFILKGTNVTAQTMTVKAPPGFSISVNGSPYSGEAIMPATGVANGLTVGIRLNSNADVGGYNGNISISAPGVTTLLVPMPLSTVRPAPITFTAEPVTKTYGDVLTTPANITTTLGLIPTLGTLKNGNTITSYTVKYADGYRAEDPAKTYDKAAELQLNDIAGNGGFLKKNYTITTIPGDIIVNKARLNIKAHDATKVYGTVLTNGTTKEFTATGLKNLQRVDEVTREYGNGAGALSNVNTYERSVALRSATGTFIATNYEVTYTEGNIIVTPATVIITANDATRLRNRDNPVFTANYQGFVNGQDENVLTRMPRITTTANRTTEAGTYPITASNAAADNYIFSYVNGKLIITAPLPLKIPNTFTPNGDGVNDVWQIGNIAAYPQCTINIFTRYGTPVFTSNGYGIAWDGTYNGQYLSSGTYYYVIKVDNVEKPLSGSITLIR